MDELEKDYSVYQVIDFLADENFIRYIKLPDPVSLAYWNNVLAKWPEKAPLMQDARDMTYLLERPVIQQNEAARKKIWEQVEASIRHERRLPFLRRYRLHLAAAVLLLLIATGAYRYFTGNVVYETGYAESRRITLPDHSQVTLNAHSKLWFARNWKLGGRREVHLEGEGFFDVKHRGDTFRLFVEDVSVTVLGTAFNVKDRRGKTVVVLQRGRIRIDVNNTPAAILSPGEGWEYNRQQSAAVKHTADTVTATAWKQQQLVLDGTTLREVVELLEDDYGYHVILNDSTLANRKLKGIVPMQRKEDLFFVLSKIFNINIIQQQDTLLFRANP